MIYAGHHLTVLAFAAGAMFVLLRGTWTYRCPRVAVICWQAVGLAAIVAVVGLLLTVGLAPYRLGVLPALARFVDDALAAGATPARLSPVQLAAVAAGLLLGVWLVAVQVRSAWHTARQRARHRQLLRLVAHRDPRADDAVVIDHPDATAYCLPGREPRVVVSAGAMRRLPAAQLRAVLAHERAHAVERHILVLLPFTALRRAVPGSRLVLRVLSAVELLVEMCADDRAVRECGRAVVADALRRFLAMPGAGAPNGALAVADVAVAARLARLDTHRRPPPLVVRASALAVAGVALATPISLFALPL